MAQPSGRRLSLEDLHLCKQPQALLRLFSILGYDVEAEAIPLSKGEIGFAPADAAAIRSLYLLADQQGQLQVVLFELETLALARLRSLAGNLLNRGGHYLLVATDTYRRITFVNPRREAGRVKIRKLVVDTVHPTRHDLDVLEGLAAHDRDPASLYQAHCQAFDVERVTRRFYQEYAELFRTVERTIQENTRGIAELQSDPAYLHAFSQRLLGRIMFLYFIQKKGWLAGDPHFLTHQYRLTVGEGGNYYARVLEPLFFETLNQRRENDASRWGPIPYLNGSLFERDYEFLLHLPNELFDPSTDEGILGLFNNYNFTVAEDTPVEQEVAVDPEMLGKVFENMMEERERGKSGTFYTPRPIVHYMCREALLGYLEERSGLELDLLQDQFDEDAGAELSVRQAAVVEQAIDEAHVLDPAVGTGAFLLGILHELVALKRACYRARDVVVPRSSALVAQWKRRFIAEALHGVDIKPEAIEIARLRLWLSLVVDLERDQVEPLPNLDYKLRVGDSLIETVEGEPILEQVDLEAGAVPAAGTQLSLGMRATEQARADLEALKEDFFQAETKAERERLRSQIEAQERGVVAAALEEKIEALDTRIRALVAQGSQVNWQGLRREQKEMERLAQQKDRLSELLRQVRAGEPLPLFLYRLHFFEVFRDRGGFDIVIANPPYVRMELIKEQKAALKAAYPQVYDGRADLYVYFYARGLDLLRNGGMLAYISSNKFMRARYGGGLRQQLGQRTTLHTVIDFGDLPVFEATAYPCVVITQKVEPPSGHRAQILSVDSLEILERLEEKVPQLAWSLAQERLLPKGWTLERPEVLQLVEKLRSAGRPLGEVVGGQFYMGVKTGLNKAFVIDEPTQQMLFEQDSRSAEIIKPWLRGRDVKRWRVNWDGLYVIFTYHGVDIERYPAVRAYLEPFRERLEQRATSANHAWYELQQPQMGIYKDFEKQKIVWPDIASSCTFALDKNCYFPDMTMFALPVDEVYLLGLLNSNVTEWFIKHISSTIQHGFVRYKRVSVDRRS